MGLGGEPVQKLRMLKPSVKKLIRFSLQLAFISMLRFGDVEVIESNH